jgi:hypothetical protein
MPRQHPASNRAAVLISAYALGLALTITSVLLASDAPPSIPPAPGMVGVANLRTSTATPPPTSGGAKKNTPAQSSPVVTRVQDTKDKPTDDDSDPMNNQSHVNGPSLSFMLFTLDHMLTGDPVADYAIAKAVYGDEFDRKLEKHARLSQLSRPSGPGPRDRQIIPDRHLPDRTTDRGHNSQDTRSRDPQPTQNRVVDQPRQNTPGDGRSTSPQPAATRGPDRSSNSPSIGSSPRDPSPSPPSRPNVGPRQ